MAIFKPKPVAPTPVIGKPVAPKPVAPTPVIGKPVMPGIKTPPPGSIGMPGGPGGKTVYNTGPMPGIKPLPPGSPMPVAPKIFYGNKQPDMGGHSSFYNSLMGGGAAPSQPVMGNNIGRPAFKMSPATFQAGMKKGGAVKAPANKMASGGKVSSASKRADGIAQRGKTRA
jgi:hypothetical protein